MSMKNGLTGNMEYCVMCRRLVTVRLSEHPIDEDQVSESHHCSACGAFLSSKLSGKKVLKKASKLDKLKFFLKNIHP